MAAPRHAQPLTKTAIVERADALLSKFRNAIADIPPEAGFGGIWARCFPGAQIVSVELDRHSATAAAAEAKLKPYPNVELLYGDSREILPQRLRSGDAVLIDGPKGFRAVELALQMFRTAKPCAVFIHDFPADSPWRKFLERHWPGVFFGDDPLFERFRVLDHTRDPRDPTHTEGRRRYGVFVCLPPSLPAPYWQLRFRLLLARLVK